MPFTATVDIDEEGLMAPEPPIVPEELPAPKQSKMCPLPDACPSLEPGQCPEPTVPDVVLICAFLLGVGVGAAVVLSFSSSGSVVEEIGRAHV